MTTFLRILAIRASLRFGPTSSRPGCTIGIFRPKLQTLTICIYVPPPIDVSNTFFFGIVPHNTLTVDHDRRRENIPASQSGSHSASNQQLICDVAGLQVGEVVVGQASSKLVTITNRGRTSLTVLSAASTGAEFGLNGLDLPLTLAAGESFTFSVTLCRRRAVVSTEACPLSPRHLGRLSPYQ